MLSFLVADSNLVAMLLNLSYDSWLTSATLGTDTKEYTPALSPTYFGLSSGTLSKNCEYSTFT